MKISRRLIPSCCNFRLQSYSRDRDSENYYLLPSMFSSSCSVARSFLDAFFVLQFLINQTFSGDIQFKRWYLSLLSLTKSSLHAI